MYKILVIDDDVSILEVVHEILTYENYLVKSLLICTDILKVAFENKPDLVIMDYLLQGESGGMHCRKLKETELTRHIPVILYSAYPNIQQSFDYYGCDDFIAKPFDIEELITKVNNLLRPKFTSLPLQ